MKYGPWQKDPISTDVLIGIGIFCTVVSALLLCLIFALIGA